MTTLAFMKKATPFVVAIVLPCMLSSCVGPGLAAMQGGALGAIANRGGGADQQGRFMGDQRRTVNQGTAAGAGVGMIAAMALGRRLGPLGQIAVIAGGAMIGNAIGQHVAMKKALAQTTEANLDACIQESIKENNRARGQVSALRAQLNSYKTRVSNARATNNTRELAGLKKELQKLHKTYDGEIKNLDVGINLQGQVVNRAGSGNTRFVKLSSSLADLQQSRGTLESDRVEVASLFHSL